MRTPHGEKRHERESKAGHIYLILETPRSRDSAFRHENEALEASKPKPAPRDLEGSINSSADQSIKTG